MKKLSILNNFLILVFGLFDLFCLITSNKMTHILICLSFAIVIFIPKILRRILKVNFSFYLENIFILFIIFAQFFGCILHWYQYISWYDSLVHFISGLLSGLLGLFLLERFNKYNRDNILFNILFIVSISMMIASCWEIFEFCSDKIFNGDTQKVLMTGVNDTMKDMICALLGSLLFIIFYVYNSMRKGSLLKKIIK